MRSETEHESRSGVDADVGVVGVGAIDSMVLCHLGRAGADCVGLERFAPGHDVGAVGGDTRLFRMAYAEGPRFVSWLRRSLELWHELETETATDVLTRCGGLTIGLPDHPYLSSARETGVEVEALPHEALRERYPQHALLPGEIALYDPSAGALRCDVAVQAAARRAADLGARVVRGAGVESIEPGADAVLVRAADRSWRFRRVVVCAGAWSDRFVPVAGGGPARIVLAWFSARDPGPFGPERFPVFVRESDGVHLYGAPSTDGVSVKVAGPIRPHPTADPETMTRLVSADERVELGRAVARFLPALDPDVVRAGAYPDYFTASTMPVLGPLPAHPRVVVATGFSDKGFKYAPAVGQAVAEFVTRGDSDLLREAPVELPG